MVTTHGVPDALADADSDSRKGQVVSRRVNHEHRIGGLALAAKHAGEIPAQAEVFTFKESFAGVNGRHIALKHRKGTVTDQLAQFLNWRESVLG